MRDNVIFKIIIQQSLMKLIAINLCQPTTNIIFIVYCFGLVMYTQPGKPTQNGYIERFNGSYRRGVLDRYIFRNLSEVRELTEAWRNDYNEERPHEALGNMTPFEYREELIKRKEAV